MSNSKQRLD